MSVASSTYLLGQNNVQAKCTTYKSMGSRGDLFQHEGCNYTERAYSYHTISK
ncbi:predicted protein [Botrytis cinerea T4]|uniref:Uncharacterized protein n=1 Tax=Botryotinia fuckeliana (strain T4) TaxID=999810 RepID=G2YN72_BOTF4|nr:predicted protein [Botrytis cinerea T4]